jgi:hypothetical protein
MVARRREPRHGAHLRSADPEPRPGAGLTNRRHPRQPASDVSTPAHQCFPPRLQLGQRRCRKAFRRRAADVVRSRRRQISHRCRVRHGQTPRSTRCGRPQLLPVRVEPARRPRDLPALAGDRRGVPPRHRSSGRGMAAAGRHGGVHPNRAVEPGLLLRLDAAELVARRIPYVDRRDVHRAVSRYGLVSRDPMYTEDANAVLTRPRGQVDVELGVRRAGAAALLMLALPGSAYLYQGEELGLPDVVELPPGSRRDPIWTRSGHRDLAATAAECRCHGDQTVRHSGSRPTTPRGRGCRSRDGSHASRSRSKTPIPHRRFGCTVRHCRYDGHYSTATYLSGSIPIATTFWPSETGPASV